MPYAAKAKIEHEFNIDHIDIYITFCLPMKICSDPINNPTIFNIKPPDEKWIVELDETETAITSSAWLDQYTMHLLIDSVAESPAEVFVSYDGPNYLLRTIWDKQWEPWSKILSTDLNFAAENLVPYTGATSALNLGSQNFRTTGTLNAGAITGTGGGDYALKIYQGADLMGFSLYGFDDKVTSKLQFGVNSTGAGTISGSSGFVFYAPGECAYVNSTSASVGFGLYENVALSFGYYNNRFYFVKPSTSEVLQLRYKLAASPYTDSLLWSIGATGTMTFPSTLGVIGLITATGGLKHRTAASNPQDATPANRPAGVVAEIVYYSGKMYFCTDNSTPTWELITSA